MKRLLSVVGLAVCLSTSAAVAQAPPKDAARTHFERGLERYGAHDYTTALHEFSTSYELGKRPAALMNVAQTQRELGRFAEAYESYARMLDAHGSQLSDTERTRVKTALDELATITGTIAIDGEPGAEVTIDGERAGTLPLAAPRRVTNGAHRVVVHRSGRAVTRDVTVVAGQEARVDAGTGTAGSPSSPAPTSPASTAAAAPPKDERTIEDVDPDARAPRKIVIAGSLFTPITLAGASSVGGSPSLQGVDTGYPVGAGAAVRVGHELSRAVAIEAIGAFAGTHHTDQATIAGETASFGQTWYSGFVGAGARLTKPAGPVRITGGAGVGAAIRSFSLDASQVSGALTKSESYSGSYTAPALLLDGGVVVRLSPKVDFNAGLLAWLDAGQTLTIEDTTIRSGAHVFLGPVAGLTFGP